MNGILNVLKPPGMTSHDVVNYTRRVLGVKKVGHAGTLDPGAAGVLVLCSGVATKLSRFFIEEDKEYRFEITFGSATSTGDSFGDVVEERDAAHITESSVKSELMVFTGKLLQIPPMTSAIKLKGKKLYELARSGVEVERVARAVTINACDYICGSGWGGKYPKALLNVSCSKGTYIRTLCEDIGKRLRTVAHMSFLLRTRAGSFNIDTSLTLEELTSLSRTGNLLSRIININEALSSFPVVMVKESAALAIASGAKLYMPGIAKMPGLHFLYEGKLVRLIGKDGLLAIAETGITDTKDFVFKPVCVLWAR